MKKIRYLIEGAFVNSLIYLFALMPVDTASNVGGFIGRNLGKVLSGANRKAMRHLRLALPNKTDAEYNAIINGMWDNLGRVFAEYPHLEQISHERMICEGEEHLKRIAASDSSAILFTGHLANWETAATYAHKVGVDLGLIFRAPNNKYVNNILQKCRSLNGKLVTFPKSAQAMRDIFAALKSGRRIGILIDQKYNQGLAMPFFGRTAMTSPAFAQLAQRFKCPLHPARIERLNGANFKLTIFPAIDTENASIEDLITQSHAMLEQWITERPEQWLWIHKRWREQKETREE